MQEKPCIVILGDILYDCFVWADRLPRKGETVSGYDNGFFSGGKGANQAVQAAKLGAEVYMIGKVGNDDHGRFVLSELESQGVNTKYISIDMEVSTGTCCVHVDKCGNNAIIVAPMANDRILTAELDQARAIIERADVFISQLQLPPEVVQYALELAKNAGVKTIFDPAPAREIDDFLLSLPDYLTPNETEAEFYSGVKSENKSLDSWCREVIVALQQKGANKLILTLGSNGVYYDDKNIIISQQCLPAKTIDTTGAGDSFAAAFAFAIAQDADPETSVLFANAAASLATTKKGGQPAMPTYDEVIDYMSSLRQSGII